MTATLEDIAHVLHARFKVPMDRIQATATFDELGLDSLSQVELAIAVEKQLGVSISDQDMAKISMVQELVSLAQQAVV